jgi:hypothetical protein
MDNNPIALRKVYFDAWQKALECKPTSPLETIIIDVIQRHPEYQAIFNNRELFENLQKEQFPIDHNPFFHLALHVTIIEQVNTDKPPGIRSIYNQLLKKYHDKTDVEHKIMKCLAIILTSQNNDTSEKRYLQSLQKLVEHANT